MMIQSSAKSMSESPNELLNSDVRQLGRAEDIRDYGYT